MDLTDNKTFQIFFVFYLFVSLLIAYTIRYILKKKGVDIDSSKNLLKLGLSVFPIVLLPLWLHPLLSIQFKILLAIAGVAFGVANFLAVDRLGRTYRKCFGIETDEDRRREEPI